MTPDLVKELNAYENHRPPKINNKIKDLIDELAHSLETISQITYFSSKKTTGIPSIAIRTTYLKKDNEIVQRLIDINEYCDVYEGHSDKSYNIGIKGKDCFNKFFEAIHEAYLDYLATTDNLKK